MSSGHADPDDTVRAWAALVGPDVAEEVIAASRLNAARIMRERLTRALVAELERHLGRDLEGVPATPGAALTEAVPVAESDPGAGTVQAAVAHPAPEASDPRSGCYVYGITWERTAACLGDTIGIDGSPIESVAAGAIAAVVSRMPSSRQWGLGPGGEVDLDALAPRARMHEWILEQVLERGPVLPLRFGVLYPDADCVRAVLRDQAGSLSSELRRLEGHSEWGLTLEVPGDPPPAADAAPGGQVTARSPDAAATRGRDYLSQRRAERDRARARSDEAAAAAAAVHEALLGVAVDSVLQRPGPHGQPSRGGVLRASYLVPAGVEDVFRRLAEEQLRAAPAGLGLSGELTGPWPAYHFCASALEGMPA